MRLGILLKSGDKNRRKRENDTHKKMALSCAGDGSFTELHACAGDGGGNGKYGINGCNGNR